jgi:hypothetical protein
MGIGIGSIDEDGLGGSAASRSDESHEVLIWR